VIEAARARRLPVIRGLAMVGAARPLHQKILLAALFLWSPMRLDEHPRRNRAWDGPSISKATGQNLDHMQPKAE